ncbi:MAG: DUF5647 family protein [Candidatus Brachytrichaceae bacterium NZ_4S206]|jgi:hypothetical protein
MAEGEVTVPERVVERNLSLTGKIMRYLIERPGAFEKLPDDFELIVLPQDDPEMWLFNLRLLERVTGEGKPIVIALLHSSEVSIHSDVSARLFAPVQVE